MTSPQLKKVTDDIEDALERVGKRMSQTLKNRTDAQREQLRRIVRETRERDKAYRHQEQNVRRPINPYEQTGFGSNTTRRYRDEFFADRRNRNSNAHVIHHAIEQQVRTNMNFFGDAMKMFTGFAPPAAGGLQPSAPSTPAAYAGGELDDLKRQMLEMQQRLEALAKK